MKTRGWIIEDGGWNTRSVWECGGPPPLFYRCKVSALPSARGLAQSKTCRIALVFCFLLLTFSFRVSGQSYSIDWYKIAGGGGTSTGGTYQVTGTIGQPDASGALTGGQFSVTGGFWSLINVVQTPGAPTLYVSHSGHTVTVYWQDVSGWNLVQSGSLTTPIASWSSSSSPTLTGGTNYLNIANLTGNLFFRLKNP